MKKHPPQPAAKKKEQKKKGPKKQNYAFIDNENVNISVQKQGRKMDRERLIMRLREKFNVDKVYMFMGYIEKYQSMYDFFEGLGYILIFKPINTNPHVPNKGNVDAELVLQAMIELPNYHQAVVVTGDGDFACLVRYLREQKKLARVIVPNEERYAGLLEDATGKQKIYSLTKMKSTLAYIPSQKEVEEDEDALDDPFYA